MATTSETLSMIRMRADAESALSMEQTHLNLEPDFQREYEAWNEKLCTRLIESVLLHRAMNPIWVVSNSKARTEEVLDGKHRLTTLIKFMNNEITIGPSLMTLDKTKYSGKKFRDLEFEDQNRIRTYSFSVNHLDSSYRDDMDKLQDMYEILNRSSRSLNEFEFNKPIFKPLYDAIGPFLDRFKESPVYPKSTSKRGALERELLKLIALTDRHIDSFSSLNNNQEKWIKAWFGSTKADMDTKIVEHKATIDDRCTRLALYMNTFVDADLFKGIDDLVAIRIVVARTTALIQDKALFQRHAPSLVVQMRTLLTSDLQKELECESRNASFQKKLIQRVDRLLEDELGVKPEPRLFPKEMTDRKKGEQENKCALCGKLIRTNQAYEGDHIQAWTSGGLTNYENLQVVHERCHKQKETILANRLATAAVAGTVVDEGVIRHAS